MARSITVVPRRPAPGNVTYGTVRSAIRPDGTANSADTSPSAPRAPGVVAGFVISVIVEAAPRQVMEQIVDVALEAADAVQRMDGARQDRDARAGARQPRPRLPAISAS